MQNQELLLLQILKFPVIIIKFLARLLSILTYLPNYAVLFLIDSVLFRQSLYATKMLYVITWLPKVALLVIVITLFVSEFYIIFSIMQLYNHGLAIQIIGMVLTFAGLIILMRKGYLSLLKKYNLTKLKSPLEHAEIGILLLIDLVGLVLWVINMALIINIGRSWDYQYDPKKNFQFIKHIFNLIRESMISYIEFFYLKIFFKLFPWRFIRQTQTYSKQKEEKNVLNCLVLLTIIYLATLQDLIVVVMFGLPCIIHPQRKSYINQMNQSHQKYKITLKQFGFVLVHLFQFIFICICTIFCWKNGVKALKRWSQHTKTDQLFGNQIRELLIETLFTIPYLITSLFILASVYKYKRKVYLMNKQINHNQANPDNKDQNQNIWITFKCFSQLIWDMCFLLLIIFSTIIKPWNIWWLGFLINQQYVMNHELIVSYFMKNFLEIMLLPFAFLTTIFIFLYQLRKPYTLLLQSGVQVYRQYYMVAGNNNAAPDHLKHRLFILQGKSQINRYCAKTCFSLKSDIPHLPIFFLAKMTFLDMYFPAIKPQTTPKLFIMLQRSYYYLSTKRSIRFNDYQQMFDRIKASGGLVSQKEQYRFWKYAYKSERLILIQKIMSFLLPRKSVEKIKAKIQMETSYSQIANYYWYHQKITKAMIIRFIYLVIESILTLIGVLFLFPLTLWRIPTFIKLIYYYKAKKFFFPILFKVYKQMYKDLIFLPVKIICILLAPRAYIMYIKNTSFKYGPLGVQTFQIYQLSKHNYLIRNILKTSFAILTIHLKILFISLFWIRIKSLKIFLRTEKLSIYSLYTEVILAKINVPTMQEMVTQSYFMNYQQIEKLNNYISDIFNDAWQDLPYFLLMLFIFLTMPWRINYIIQTIKDMRQDTTERKSFFKLLKNIFKDYACIFMNIVLLLSGFKTKKALFLIRRNYRLNFFIGFLEYSYFQQLTKQMRSLGIIYKNLFFMVIAVLFGWTRTGDLVNQILALKNKKKQEQQSAAKNKKLYEDTVKSGKQLQTLHKMGFYNYLTVCSFLTVPQIITLRHVDQFNYMMTKRQQIWFMKWQHIYSKNSNEISQSFEVKCKNAFIMVKNQNAGQIVSYEQIIMKHFYDNIFQNSVDIAEFLRERIPIRYYNILFTNYVYSVADGYGPENQLPQEDNQDEQFLRLTNQVRRPIVELTENEAWLHLLYVRMNERIAQKIHRFYRQDTYRRLKQLSFIFGLLAIVTIYLLTIWIFRDYIFCIEPFIGVKFVLAFYFHTFIALLFHRCSFLMFGWVSLRPFDLYYDVIKIKNYLIQQTKTKVIFPTRLFLTKCWNKFKQIWKIIYGKLRDKGAQVYQKLKKVGLKIKSGAQKAKDVIVRYSVLAYEKVVKPLYISIADKIRKLKDFIVYLFTVVIKSIKSFLQFIGRLITSFYEAMKSVISHINNLYFFILKSSMQFFLKFGIIGNLVFTLFGLFIMTMPSLIWLIFYGQRWYLIVSTIHTMVLIVIGYKHLNKIRIGSR